MTADDGAARAAAPGSPVLFIVDADPQARVVAELALVRRFGPDYRVLAVATPEDALNALQRLAEQGGEVALVAADLRLPGMDGVEFLERAHALHPGSWRVLLVAMALASFRRQRTCGGPQVPPWWAAWEENVITTEVFQALDFLPRQALPMSVPATCTRIGPHDQRPHRPARADRIRAAGAAGLPG